VPLKDRAQGSAAESCAASMPGVAPPSPLGPPPNVAPADAPSPLLPETNGMPADPGAPAEPTEELPEEAFGETPDEPDAAVARPLKVSVDAGLCELAHPQMAMKMRQDVLRRCAIECPQPPCGLKHIRLKCAAPSIPVHSFALELLAPISRLFRHGESIRLRLTARPRWPRHRALKTTPHTLLKLRGRQAAQKSAA
jgi:hypothetical protein